MLTSREKLICAFRSRRSDAVRRATDRATAPGRGRVRTERTTCRRRPPAPGERARRACDGASDCLRTSAWRQGILSATISVLARQASNTSLQRSKCHGVESKFFAFQKLTCDVQKRGSGLTQHRGNMWNKMTSSASASFEFFWSRLT